MNESVEFLQQVIDRVLALEPAKLMPLGSIALGYALRSFGWFPNKGIPAVCFVFMLVAYPMVARVEGQATSKWIIDGTLAIVLWGVAWMAYEKVLKPIEKKLTSSRDGN